MHPHPESQEIQELIPSGIHHHQVGMVGYWCEKRRGGGDHQHKNGLPPVEPLDFVRQIDDDRVEYQRGGVNRDDGTDDASSAQPALGAGPLQTWLWEMPCLLQLAVKAVFIEPGSCTHLRLSILKVDLRLRYSTEIV